MRQELENIRERYEKLTQSLSDPANISDPKELRRISKERAELEPVVRKYESFQKIRKEIQESKEIIEDGNADEELKELDKAIQVTSEKIIYKDDKTFYLKNGTWVDSRYEEGSPVQEIQFNSDEYFRLLAQKPGIAKYLSVASNIIVHFEGKNYKIVDPRAKQENK